MKLFVDMDGVLADFRAHYLAEFGESPGERLGDAGWDRVRSVKDFYLNIPPMTDMRVLWDYVAKYNPIVLTGIPYSIAEATDNKTGWIRKNIGDHVEVRCCRPADKFKHCETGDILIDDSEFNIKRWVRHL